MFDKFITHVFTFFLFSAIGWAIESMYRSLGERRVINSGFNHGPVCPIYGTGMLVFEIILVPLSMPFEKRWWVTILLGIVAADTVEYITSYVMEKLFHARWWDYSKNFLNINGRVCFKHSVYWAIAAFLACYIVSPMYHAVLKLIPQNVRLVTVIVVFVVFAFDLTLTVRAAIDIQNVMKKLESLRQLIAAGSDMGSQFAAEVKYSAEAKYGAVQKNISEKSAEFTEWRREVIRKYTDFRETVDWMITGERSARGSRETKRLLNNYRNLRDKISDGLKQIEARIKDIPGIDEEDGRENK